MSNQGSNVWYIPDTYLPEPIQADGPYIGHEAICVLNVTDKDASVQLDFYFEDRPPIKGITLVVPSERTRHVRLDDPEQLGGYEVPLSVGYAVRIRSDVPIIVQYTRVDTTQVQCALMSTMAYPLD